MRLNADMIARSPAFFNAMKDRELDLRGNKISVIENLAATQDQFDSLDLSDNEIRKLECMAVLPRVKLLMFNNNQLNRIADNLGRAFPKLEMLVLTNNRFATLKELEALASLPTLIHLSLVDNPVTKVPNYRAFVIAMLPKLRVLDLEECLQLTELPDLHSTQQLFASLEWLNLSRCEQLHEFPDWLAAVEVRGCAVTRP